MRNNTKDITLGALLSVVSIILLYMTSILVTTKLTLLVLSSLVTAVAVLKSNLKTAILSYLSTSILAMFLVPDKGVVLAYILFFGYYSVIKYLIERLDKTLLEWILKLTIYNLMLTLAYYISTLFLNIDIRGFFISFPLGAIILILEILFVIYDIALSIAISRYQKYFYKY